MTRSPENVELEIAATARLVRREATRRAALFGATETQWRVMARLKLTGGGLRQVELAELLDLEPITLCHVIDQLEDAGLVRRCRNPRDRRAWQIHLTPKLDLLITELERMGRALDAEILAGIDYSDLGIVRTVLAKIRENINRGNPF